MFAMDYLKSELDRLTFYWNKYVISGKVDKKSPSAIENKEKRESLEKTIYMLNNRVFDYTKDEYILCSAIRYGESIISGRRHSDCYKTLKQLVKNPTISNCREDQGFLTSKNRFVDRNSAWRIADRANQIRFGKKVSSNSNPDLISENLFGCD